MTFDEVHLWKSRTKGQKVNPTMASRKQRPILISLICLCAWDLCCQRGHGALSDLASLVEQAPHSRLRKPRSSSNGKWADDIKAAMNLDDPSIVKTKLGDIQGELLSQGRRFRTIPYTQPPTGSLRWQPPRMVEPWKPNVINATFGKEKQEEQNN